MNKHLGQRYKDSNGIFHLARCKKCFPIIKTRSRLEIEIYDYCKKICDMQSLQILSNCRNILKIGNTKLDADIYIPKMRLIIEVDGNYYHSEEFYKTEKQNGRLKNIYRKIDKTICAETNGFQLIHINEDDWLNNTDSIKILIMLKITLTFSFNTTQDILVINREIHNKNDQPIGYQLIKEIDPTIEVRSNLHILNCGQLIYLKIN